MVRRRRVIWTNLLREVRVSRSRFFSILAIVGIGVGFFGGVRAAGPDMRASADRYYHENALMDFRLLSTAGFSDADIAALNALEGVTATPSRFTDCIEKAQDQDMAVRVCSYEDTLAVNHLILLSGRLPQAENECLVDGSGFHAGAALGSLVKLSGDGENLGDVLKNTVYTVVGTFQSPLYVSGTGRGSTTVGDGSIADVLVVPQSNFKQEVYTQVYVQVSELSGLSAYSKAYKTARENWAEQLSRVGEQRAPLRLAELRQTLSDALSSGEQQLADARAAVQQTNDRLQQAKEQLEASRLQLQQGKEALAAARGRLDEGRKALAEAGAQSDAALASAVHSWPRPRRTMPRRRRSCRPLRNRLRPRCRRRPPTPRMRPSLPHSRRRGWTPAPPRPRCGDWPTIPTPPQPSRSGSACAMPPPPFRRSSATPIQRR